MSQKPLFGMFRWMVHKVSGMGLGRIPGMVKLYNFLFARTRPKGIVLAECQGSRMFVNADEQVQHSAILIRGEIDPGQTRLFKRLLRPGMSVIDIGANIGYYTLIAARAVGPQGRVYAFEPAPANFDLLSRSIAENGYTNVVARQMAVSEKPGTMKLYLSGESGLYHSLMADIVDDVSEAVEVGVASLDDTFGEIIKERPIELIKMDAECAEPHIIAGGQRVLSQPKLTVLMELHAPALRRSGGEPLPLLQTLERLGFAVHIMDYAEDRAERATPAEVIARSDAIGGHVELMLSKGV